MNGRSVLRGIKAAVFDLDGTLFDSTHIWSDIDEVFLRKRGRTPTAEYKRAIAALGNREAARFTVDYYGLEDAPEALTAEWADLAREAYAHSVELVPGAAEYIKECAEAGVKLLIVTSLARELAEPCLENNGILRYFAHIITADDSGYSKTSEKIFTYAADLAGCAVSECVAFDDVAAAVSSAKRAGMTTVAVRCKTSYHADMPDFDSSADFLIESFDVAPILLG